MNLILNTEMFSFLIPGFIFFYLWANRGFSFMRALILSWVIRLAISAISGIIWGVWSENVWYELYILTVVVLAFWVYGNSKEEKVRLGWLFAVMTFVFPLFGLLIYLIFRRTLSKVEVHRYETENGKIEIIRDKK